MMQGFERYNDKWVAVNTLGGFTYLGTLVNSNFVLLLRGSNEEVTTIAKEHVVGIAVSNAPRTVPNRDTDYTHDDYDPDLPWVTERDLAR